MRLFPWIFVLVVFETCAAGEDEISRWIRGIRSFLQDCPLAASGGEEHRYLPGLGHCLQRRAIVALDALLMDDVIPILDGFELVRYDDQRTRVNVGEHPRNNRTNDDDDDDDDDDDAGGNRSDDREDVHGWQHRFASKLTRFFRTHVLRIDLDRASQPAQFSSDNDLEGSDARLAQARRRHGKRKGIFPIMMMGFIFMGTILIPMGFQFLAVLSGKALILAKMALILSSIQGLRKIATTGVNYGLYHSPGPESWHERSVRDG